MFAKIIEGLQSKAGNSSISSQRRHERRSCDQCVTVIGERMYPLVDWSMGGLQITGDERLFGVNQQIELTMKFRVNDSVMDVPHKARVVRKAKNRVAFEFLPLSQAVKNKFQAVVDDFMTREFADSQMV